MPVTGLARVTVNAPRRRLAVALPEQAPVAELLPELLRHAGAGLLMLTGIVAARGYGDGVAGAAVAGYALPYAFAGGLLLLPGPSVLVGSAALVLAGMVGVVGVGHGLRIFVGAVTAGCFGVLG